MSPARLRNVASIAPGKYWPLLCNTVGRSDLGGARVVTTPVQYDEKPAVPARAPEFNEHGDEILGDLGLDWDAIIDLETRGIVA